MVRSMTGFGSSTATAGGWRAEVTIRTWNHRYLSVRARALGDRPALQAQIEERVKAAFGRGEVGVWLDLQPDRSDQGRALFDVERASATYSEIAKIGRDLGIDDAPSLEALIRAGGLQPTEESDADVWPAVLAALEEAIDRVSASREQEGAILAEDLTRLIRHLRELSEAVESRLPELASALRTRLLERIADVEANVEPERLEAEIALLVERYDVQEELVRLRGHLERASRLFESDGPLGKELDFLSQELLREVNTIGSKARDSEVSGLVIDMKLAVEQFREQVQNVE